MIRPLLSAAALAAALAALPPAARPGEPAEKPAATVRGRPLPRSAVYAALGRKFLRGPGGDRILDQFLGETVARREQERRGATVSEEEIATAVEGARREFAERMARAGRKVEEGDALDQFLRSAGYTLEEFRAHTRQYLALQKMAREDLGARGEVPNAQIDVWLRDLQQRWKVATDPAVLPPGAVALVGEEPVTEEQAGRWLARTVKRHEVVGAVYDAAFGAAVEERAAREGVTLTDEETAAEVYRLRRRFLSEPSVEGTGLTFEAWLRETTGLTPEEWRRDPGVRANLLARKVLAAGLDAASVRAAWEKDPGRYGETARIRRILVRGEDRASVFGSAGRPMAEARGIADRALEEIRSGKEFDAVARKYSEDNPAAGARGRPLEVAPQLGTTLLPQSVIDEVFRAKEGALLGPLKSVDGWHLVLVEKRTPAPTFEEARDRVRDDLVARALQEWRVAMRSDPEVVIAEDL